MVFARKCLFFSACFSVALVIAGCGSSSDGGRGGSGGGNIIRVEGSDTMVNLAQAWAEEYHKVNPDISIQVTGGGSGVGIASLIDGVADMSNSSRKMREKELARAEQNTGEKPKEYVVGLDALAVYVHKNNPIESISLEELAEIYGDGGRIVSWKQLEVKIAGCTSDEIQRVSRQNNSGTYHYFREAILGEARDFKLGSIDQSGSKDVVELVAKTPCAIGYSGMGYKTDEVKWLKISKSKGEEGILPSVETAKEGSYPIARPLYVYTRGEPTGPLKDYLDWIMSPAGQRVVLDLGYVPVASLESAPASSGKTEDDTSDENESAEEDQSAEENESAN